MGTLLGLSEYLEEHYESSVFDAAAASGKPWDFHLHGHRIVTASLVENRKWDITLQPAGKSKEEIQKIQVKFLYPEELGKVVKPLIKADKAVKDLALEPILSPRKRRFVKNKSLFPLMKEEEVIIVTSLEGDEIKGLIADFTRYDLTVKMKGGLVLTVLRHAIYEIRNKRGRSFLKSFQEEHRDWEKSPLFVPASPDSGPGMRP